MAQTVGVGSFGVTLVGTDAAPLVLGATGGATDVMTYTHDVGVKAEKVEVLTAVNHALVPDASITLTQPNANTIVLTNTTAGPLSVIARITWVTPSVSLTASVAASDAAIVFT